MTELNQFVDDEEPEIWDWFAGRPFPEQKWKVQNIVPEAGTVIIAGGSTEGKSWFAMELTKALAYGTPFLGNFETEKSTVLFINQEMSKAELYRRGMLLGFGKPMGRIWVLTRNELDLNNEIEVQWLLDFIEERLIDVVVVDTFRAVAGSVKDDNANDIMDFFQRFKILKEKGVALVFLDHTRKPERFDGKNPKKEQLFGSQYKLGAIEILVMLKKTPDGEIVVHQFKNRLGLEFEPFKVTMKDKIAEDGQKIVEFTYEGGFEQTETKKEEAKDFILNALSEGGRTRQECIDMALKEQKIGVKNTSDALRELEDGGKVVMEKLGRKNFYTLPKEELEEENKLLI